MNTYKIRIASFKTLQGTFGVSKRAWCIQSCQQLIMPEHYTLERNRDDQSSGYISPGEYLRMQDWLDTMDRYDDPKIDDMEEVWGL